MADYTRFTVKVLKALCKESGVSGYSSKSKDQIVELLKAKNLTQKLMQPCASHRQTPMEIDPTREYVLTENEKKAYANNTKAKFKTAEEELAWARTQTKNCIKCKDTLPLSYFSGNTSSADHFDKNGYRLRRGDCKKCNKEQNAGKSEAVKIAKEMGLSFKAPPGTKCELCETTENIVFDHDHSTKTHRGWLCNPCNRSMGVLGDDVEGMIRVINYLNKKEKKKVAFDPKTFELKIV